MKKTRLLSAAAALLVLTGCGAGAAESRPQSSSPGSAASSASDSSQAESSLPKLTKDDVRMTRSAEYFFDRLEDERFKQAALITLEGLRDHSEAISLESLDLYDNEFDDIFDLLISCEPELGWVENNYELDIDTNDDSIITAYFKYKLSREEEEAAVEKLKAVVTEVNAAAAGLDDFGRMLYFHDYIVTECDYSTETGNAWSAYGCLVDGKAVCEGYSKALIALCEEADMLCIPVGGSYAQNSSALHMWNKVVMDGEWYNMDVTWDDPTDANDSPVKEEKDGIDYIHRDYFGLTDKETETDHRFTETSVLKYPAADAVEDNYFIRTGAYVSDPGEASDTIYRLAAEAAEKEEQIIQFRCSGSEVYDSVFELEFSENGRIFDILGQLNREGYPVDPTGYRYISDKERCIITILIDYSK